MANFIVCCDPDQERSSHFLTTIQPLLPPVEDLIISSVLAKNFSAIWAANEQAPIHSINDDRGVGILWGDALCADGNVTAEQLRDKWDAKQNKPFESFDGFHAAAVFKPLTGLVVGADILGLFPVYYYASGDIILIGSSPELFQYHPLFHAEFNPVGLVGILLTNGLLDNETLLKGVKRLDAGHVLVWQPGNVPQEIPQYRIPIATKYFDMTFSAQLRLIDQVLSSAVSRHCSGDEKVGLLLSGGLDSRTVAGYLKANKKDVAALTLGESTDIEMRCAAEVAKNLHMPHHVFSIESSQYRRYANIQSTWEHCANGFNNIWGWGIPSLLKKFPQRVATGFFMDVALGGVYPKHYKASITFETLFSQDNNSAFSPVKLSNLLKKEIFDNLVDEVIAKMKNNYEKPAEHETQRTLCYKLSHRQRFHVGGMAWQMSFGAWPIMPVADRQVLEVVGGLPPATLSERRAQNELLCWRFPELASIPLDTNSYDTVLLRPRLRHLLMSYYISPVINRLGNIYRRDRPERRHYYRLYDINGPGWIGVRREAEKYRDGAADFFDMDVFNKLLPAPETKIPINDGITDASGLKILLGFLLWNGKRNFGDS